MAVTFTTSLRKDLDKNASGIVVPPEAIAALNSGKRPKVTVSLNGYTYRSTVAGYGDLFLLPFSQAHREASGLNPGDDVEVVLELDTASRKVEVPEDLATALSKKAGVMEAFDAVSDSRRKEFVRQVEEAKAPETRARRIAAIVEKFSA